MGSRCTGHRARQCTVRKIRPHQGHAHRRTAHTRANVSDAAYCYCDAIYPEYACGRFGEVWVTSAGIVERQTHEKLYYHFENGMCKSWYCKNCHTYSWK